MQKEEILLKKRFLDLKRTADNRTIPAFSDFLNSNELSLLYGLQSEFPKGTFRTFGGYKYAERQMAMFLPDAFFYEEENFPYPIALLEIRPVSKKFAEDLNHRDFLGALMNLGIERSLLGDISVKENASYVFCCERIAPYICENLFRIKHTQVRTAPGNLAEFQFEPEFDMVTGSVTSLRLDAVLAMVYKQSRSESNGKITAGLVFVNQRLVQNTSHILKENDIVSFRGFGKFIVDSIGGQSKKGKTYITVRKFV